jgi:ketosteroid isomerase-like protein
MRLRRGLMIVAGLVIVAATASAKGNDASVRRSLQMRYEAFTRAFQKKDASAWKAMLTADYEVKQPDEPVMDRARAEKDMTGAMMSMDGIRWKRTIEKLNVSGDCAVATVRGRLTATTTGRDGSKHKMRFDGLTRDTWVLSGAEWKIRLSELLESRMLIDGKQAGPPAGKRAADHRLEDGV